MQASGSKLQSADFNTSSFGFAQEVLERLTSEPSKCSGMYDEFNYGYLGFALRPDGRTVHHLTTGSIREGAPPAAPARTGRRGPREDLRLLTYDIPSAKDEDHGAIFPSNAQRPKLVHSIAVARDGSVCALANCSRNGRRLTGLIRVGIPVK